MEVDVMSSDQQEGNGPTNSDEEIDDQLEGFWNETLYLPEAHLITEESFNKFFSREKYWDFLTAENQHRQTEKLPAKQEKQQGTITKYQISPDSKIQQDNSLQNDIFEKRKTTETTSSSFGLHTKYHLSIQPKVSAITTKERRFYAWFMKMKQGTKGKMIEANEDRFQDLLCSITREQGEYLNFLHSCFTTQPYEYVYLSNSVRDFVMNKVSKATQTLLQSTIKVFFVLLKTIAITRPSNISNSSLEFAFINCISEQERIPAVSILPCNTALPTSKESTHSTLQLNVDENTISDLCEQSNATIYIQQSALTAILESWIDPNHEYLIPISIEQKECAPGTDDENSIIIILAPNPQRHLTFREANHMHYTQVTTEYLIDKDKRLLQQSGSDTCVNLFTCGTHRILVESRIDCIDLNTKETYSMNAKTEFQSYVGFEQFSLRDLCRFWWKSKLSNTKHILCSRIDPRNNCMRRLDQYTRDILCAPGCPYNPKYFFPRISTLFDLLLSCPSGKYMLEHAIGNNHLFLFQEKDKGFTTYETKYKDLLTGKRQLISDDPKTIQWLPIDMKIVPSHFPANVIPWLFDVPSYSMQFYALGNKKQNTQSKQKSKQKQKQTSKKNQKKKDQKNNKMVPLHDSFRPARCGGFPKTTVLPISADFPGEPLPPGVELNSPTLNKTPVIYDDDVDFGSL